MKPCKGCAYYIEADGVDPAYCEYWAEDDPPERCDEYCTD